MSIIGKAHSWWELRENCEKRVHSLVQARPVNPGNNNNGNNSKR